MRRLICVMVICMVMTPMLQAQILSSIVVNPLPNCIAGNQDGYGTMGREGSYLDPTPPNTWGKCFNGTGVADLMDLGKFVNTRMDVVFIFEGDMYNPYMFGYLGAPTGCNLFDYLTASAEWHQTFQNIVIHSDAYFNVVISCFGITCGYQESTDWQGGVGAADPTIYFGVPEC